MRKQIYITLFFLICTTSLFGQWPRFYWSQIELADSVGNIAIAGPDSIGVWSDSLRFWQGKLRIGVDTAATLSDVRSLGFNESGTASTIPLWNTSTTLGDSWLSQSGSRLTLLENKILRQIGGTTANRPAGLNGDLWYNQDSLGYQFHDGSNWVNLQQWKRDSGSPNNIYFNEGSVGFGGISSPESPIHVNFSGSSIGDFGQRFEVGISGIVGSGALGMGQESRDRYWAIGPLNMNSDALARLNFSLINLSGPSIITQYSLSLGRDGIGVNNTALNSVGIAIGNGYPIRYQGGAFQIQSLGSTSIILDQNTNSTDSYFEVREDSNSGEILQRLRLNDETNGPTTSYDWNEETYTTNLVRYNENFGNSSDENIYKIEHAGGITLGDTVLSNYVVLEFGRFNASASNDTAFIQFRGIISNKETIANWHGKIKMTAETILTDSFFCDDRRFLGDFFIDSSYVDTFDHIKMAIYSPIELSNSVVHVDGVWAGHKAYRRGDNVDKIILPPRLNAYKTLGGYSGDLKNNTPIIPDDTNVTTGNLIFTKVVEHDLADNTMTIDGSGGDDILVLDGDGQSVGIASTPNSNVALKIGGTEGVQIPSGTTGERPVTASVGIIRNTTTAQTIEGYMDGEWRSMQQSDEIVTTSTGATIIIYKNTLIFADISTASQTITLDPTDLATGAKVTVMVTNQNDCTLDSDIGSFISTTATTTTKALSEGAYSCTWNGTNWYFITLQ